MGLNETLEELQLDDDVKAKILADHEGEVNPLTEQVSQLRGRSKKEGVEQEVVALSDMGFGKQPGLLKFVRRVFLSDDEEPAIVLLSDADLELSGDEALDAKDRQEMSAAGVLREFIKLMQVGEDGKLMLSDQILASDEIEEKPEEEEGGDEEKKKAASRKRAEGLLGRPITRKGREPAGVGGGDS